MKKHEHVWTWPIAGYLFLGGLGAGMTVVATVADLFFGLGFLFIPCASGALVALGLGSFLLVFELGRPFQFWRVFSKERAILTFGAWMVISLIAFNVIYLSFWFNFIPWFENAGLRSAIAIICLLLGSGVMLYTGVELSSMKARVLWNTPALPMVFALSGMLVGLATDYLVIGFWPYAASVATTALGAGAELAAVQSTLAWGLGILAVATLVATFIYILMMYFSASSAAREAATRWLKGSYAGAFWGGLVVVGSMAPLALLALGGTLAVSCAALCAIIGGVCLRFLVVYSDDTRKLDGEALYHRRLPQGDELFLKRTW